VHTRHACLRHPMIILWAYIFEFTQLCIVDSWECLKHDIVLYFIENEYKMNCYRGLREFEKVSGFLMDTCLSEQDKNRS
jgi:hypothetical protein